MEEQTEIRTKKIRKIRYGRILFIILIILIIVFGAYNLTSSKKRDKNMAATIGTETITISELNEKYDQLPDLMKAFKPKSQTLTEIINEKLLLKKVKEYSITVNQTQVENRINEIKQTNNLNDSDFEQKVKEIGFTIEEYTNQTKNLLLIETYLEKELFKDLEVSDEDIQTQYDNNPDLYTITDQLTVSHILISNTIRSDEDAQIIISTIKERVGIDNFTDMVMEYSEDPSKVQNNGLLKFTKGQMVPEFEQAAFELEIEQVSQPVKTAYGYHLIKLHDRIDGEKLLEFDEVKDHIKKELQYEKETQKIIDHIEELKKEYNVKIYYKDEQ